MELRFCDECGSRISEEAMAAGKAADVDDFCYCPKCYKKKLKSEGKSSAAGDKPGARQPETVRLKPPTPGRGSKPRLSRDTPATVKLPAGARKGRPSTAKVKLPGSRSTSSGRLKRIEAEGESANWGRTFFNGIMLLVGGMVLGYLGYMLVSRNRKPRRVPGPVAPTPQPQPTPQPEPTPQTEPRAVPAAPGELRAEVAGENGFKLEWKDNSVDEAAFLVERRKITKTEVLAPAGPFKVELVKYNGRKKRPTVAVAGTADSFRKGARGVKNEPAWTWVQVPRKLEGQTRLFPAWEGTQGKSRERYVVRVSGPCMVYLVCSPTQDDKRLEWMVASWKPAKLTCKNEHGVKTVWVRTVKKAGELTLGDDTENSQAINYVFVPGPDAKDPEAVPTPKEDAWEQVARVDANVVTYTDGGLEPGAGYEYRLRASNAKGFSEYSGVLKAILSKPAAGAVLAVPSDLACKTVADTEVQLSWKDESEGETGFAIERREANSGAWQELTVAPAGATGHKDAGLKPGTRYEYRVRARGGQEARSEYSNVAGVKTPEGGVAPPVSAGLSKGLVLHLKFDEQKAGAPADSSGKALPTTVKGAPQPAKGKIGGAWKFNGKQDSDLVSVDFKSAPSPKELTVAVWVKPEVLFEKMPHTYPHIVAHGSSHGKNGYTLGCSVSRSNAVGMRVRSARGWKDVLCPETGSGEWLHLAGTYDGRDLKLYRNGALVKSLTVGPEAMDAPPSKMGVGKMKGLLDDLRIYDRALSGEEVAVLAAGGNTKPVAADDGEIKARATSATEVEVSWKVKLVTGHKAHLYRCTTSDKNAQDAHVSSSYKHEGTHKDTGLLPDTEYAYKLKWRRALQEEPRQKSVNVRTDKGGAGHSTGGGRTRLALRPASTTAVLVELEGTVLQGVKYDVYRLVAGVSPKKIAELTAEKPSKLDAGLKPDIDVAYYAAWRQKRGSSRSRLARIRTPRPLPAGECLLKASPLSASGMRLQLDIKKWTVMHYALDCRSDGELNWRPVCVVAKAGRKAFKPGPKTFVDQGLEAGTAYHYRVRVHYAGVARFLSMPVKATTSPAGTPEPPEGLAITAKSRSSAALTWKNSDPKAVGFEVQRGERVFGQLNVRLVAPHNSKAPKKPLIVPRGFAKGARRFWDRTSVWSGKEMLPELSGSTRLLTSVDEMNPSKAMQMYKVEVPEDCCVIVPIKSMSVPAWLVRSKWKMLAVSRHLKEWRYFSFLAKGKQVLTLRSSNRRISRSNVCYLFTKPPETKWGSRATIGKVTSWVDSGLAPTRTYYYRLIAIGKGGLRSGASSPFVVHVAYPPTPRK